MAGDTQDDGSLPMVRVTPVVAAVVGAAVVHSVQPDKYRYKVLRTTIGPISNA